CANGRVGLDYW
nr:immunoglobulin heavy chain junction region [Macaca mulatta]